MFKAEISKESLRKAIGRKRLPNKMLLYLTGAMMHDILRENGEDDSYELMNSTYCLGMRSIGRKKVRIAGRFSLRRKMLFDLAKMKAMVEKDAYLNAQFYTMQSMYDGDGVYEALFKKYVRGYPRAERKYRNA